MYLHNYLNKSRKRYKKPVFMVVALRAAKIGNEEVQHVEIGCVDVVGRGRGRGHGTSM